MSANKEFSSNGKLLLTGEYLILKGALALAVPLKRNHLLKIESAPGKNEILWESYDIDGKYFSGQFKLQDLSCRKFTNEVAQEFISNLLVNAKKLNRNFLKNDESIKVTSRLSFSRKWGWGGSSTTISNVAQWAGLNPFKLFFSTQKGSAYDIACSISNSPILYQLRKNEPTFEKTEINPTIKSNAYFIFTGKKADTKTNVKKFISSNPSKIEDIEKVSALTKEIASANNLEDLSQLINEHEKIISSIIKSKAVREDFFNDFNGSIKSLGAWGGDFLMAISEKGPEYIKEYFSKKSMYPVFAFNEIVLC